MTMMMMMKMITVLYVMVLYFMVWYGIVWYGMVWNGIVLYCKVFIQLSFVFYTVHVCLFVRFSLLAS